MRCFGSIHFPDSYLFAPALGFIVHIANQSHDNDQQDKGGSDPDGIAEAVYVFIDIFHHLIYQDKTQGYIRIGVFYKLIQTFQILVIWFFQADIKCMVGIFISNQDNRRLRHVKTFIANITEYAYNRSLNVIHCFTYCSVGPFHQTYQFFVYQ